MAKRRAASAQTKALGQPRDQETRDQLNHQAEVVSGDVARYIARYDCQNVDVTISPIELLRDVAGAFAAYDQEIEDLRAEIEAFKEGESEQMVALQQQILDLKHQLEKATKLKVKLDKAPWLNDLLTKIP